MSDKPINIVGSHGIKVPKTIDERWYSLIDLMSSTKYPSVIALGCFANHVTFYSQQVRALNLIDALCNTGKVRSGDSIAVVGAGLAGLTAAAAALARGLTVHLFEKKGNPAVLDGRMPLQTDSQKRWIDPFVYDWPKEHVYIQSGDLKPDEQPVRAGLPLLDWQAALADDVRREISIELDKQIERFTNKISFYPELLTQAQVDATVDSVTIAANGNRPSINVRYLLLAVGFGTENDPTYRYWTDDGFAGDQFKGKTFLVSGTGDGGLTDVMRLCIPNFKHRTVLDDFRTQGKAHEDLIAATQANDLDVSQAFLQAAERIAQRLPKIGKRDVTVYLTGSPDRVFKGRASTLNRLILAWLLHEKRASLVDARVKMPLPPGKGPKGGVTVQFEDWDGDNPTESAVVWTVEGEKFERGGSAPCEFDFVITRHGPARPSPLEADFPDFYKAFGRRNLDWWRQTSHLNDWTRFPLWQPDSYASPLPLDPVIARTRLIPAQPLYAVVETPSTDGFVSRVASGVQDVLHANSQTIALNASTVFKSAAQLGRCVRILSQAEIAIFDLTGVTPESMFLLGIRAAVRRGLSVVTARFPEGQPQPAPSDAPFALATTMPYLIRDVNVIGWQLEEAFRDQLQRSVEEGIAKFNRLGPLYSDLGVYDAVRNIGSHPADFSEEPVKNTVLLLAPFDKAYRGKNAEWLRARFASIGTDKLRYIVETPTPELNSVKLYASLRRTKMCVVDWTHSRPNVFFELGVRLAINKRPVVSIIAADELENKVPKRADLRNLVKLLRPFAYSPGVDREHDRELRGFIDECRKSLEQPDFRGSWPYTDRDIAPDFVSRQVAACIGASNEFWSIPVWEELTRAADSIVGPEPQANPIYPALYGDKGRMSEAALDRLIAAWYFLDRRYQIRQAGFDKANSEHMEWLRLGHKIVLRGQFLGGAYQHIAKEVEQTLQVE